MLRKRGMLISTLLALIVVIKAALEQSGCVFCFNAWACNLSLKICFGAMENGDNYFTLLREIPKLNHADYEYVNVE